MTDLEKPSFLEPGYRIDRYELLYAIAQGGMGSVWVARLQGKHGFEKLYAIKTILPQYAQEDRFRTMFLDEARIASAIIHPNVAQITDLGEQHGVLYLVMEYVEGDSLHRLLRVAERAGARIPHGVLLRIVADVCAGLHVAHELLGDDERPLEIVHRDVSPQNVLVSLSGQAKVIDFGVAKARDRLGGETTGAVLKGKVRFIAPEQALGMPVDRRADIWSLGAVMHTLILGIPPYDGENDVAVLRDLISGKPIKPLPATLPRPLARVLHKSLDRDPAKRYPTAAAMRKELEQVAQEMSAPFSYADVGSYVLENTKDRIASRKRALELARESVAERARLRSLLDQPQPGDTVNLSAANASARKLLSEAHTMAGPNDGQAAVARALEQTRPRGSENPLESQRPRGSENLLESPLLDRQRGALAFERMPDRESGSGETSSSLGLGDASVPVSRKRGWAAPFAVAGAIGLVAAVGFSAARYVIAAPPPVETSKGVETLGAAASTTPSVTAAPALDTPPEVSPPAASVMELGPEPPSSATVERASEPKVHVAPKAVKAAPTASHAPKPGGGLPTEIDSRN